MYPVRIVRPKVLPVGPIPACTVPQIATHSSRFLIWNRWAFQLSRLHFLDKDDLHPFAVGATYNTNKDIFIFFKAVAAERMRQSRLSDCRTAVKARPEHFASSRRPH